MATNYSPELVTDSIMEAWDPLVPSTNTSATLLYDRVGSTNGTMYTGGCLTFDGTDDYITMSDIDSEFSDYFTLSVWLKPDALTGETWVFAGENGGGIGFYIRQSNDDLIFRHNGIGDGTTNVSNIFDTNWAHYVFNWDGTNTNVYKDGVRVGGEAATGTLAADAFNGPRIGDDTGAADREWDGLMADFRLYNVALSASQVTEIYNNSKVVVPSNVSQANLIVWYTMIEGVGAVAYDGSGNGNHGALPNGPTWAREGGAPALVGGFNRPMLFDGAADYVNCGDSNALVTGTTLSVSGWVRTVDTDKGRLFQAQKGAGSTSYSLVLNDNNGVATAGYVSCLTFNGLSVHNYVSYDASIDDGAWHHLAMTTTASAQKLYVDGALVASGATTFGNTVSADKAVIGSLGGTDEFVGGVINEVVLYDSELSLAQVQALAATGPNGGPLPPDAMGLSNSSDVVAYWRNDGAIAANGEMRWIDRSGNGNNGLVVAGTESLMFKQGVNGNANVNTGRDNQGFPLLCKDVGATGYNGDISGVGGYYISLGTSAAQIAGLGSLDAWVYPTADKWMYFFIKGYGGTNSLFLGGHSAGLGAGKWSWFFGSYDGGYKYIYWGTDGGFEADYANRWHYLTMTFNKSLASDNWKVYWNGEYNTAVDWTSDLGTIVTDAQLGGSRYWSGQIGPIRTYNRVLSQDEIQQNYKAQRSRFE